MMPTQKDEERSFEPFVSFYSEQLAPEMIHAIRVDRDSELGYCVDCLDRRRNNLLLYGERGIGKTFLVKLLHDHIASNASHMLACYLNLASLGFYGRDEVAIGAFPNAVLLGICTTIWCTVLGRDYSELRVTTYEQAKTIKWPNRLAAKVAEIYGQLMTSALQLRLQQENSFGASALLKSDFKESFSKQWSPSEVLPFEFFHFVDDLFKAILKKHKIDRIIVICDEANNLPMREQQEILLRYLELFGAKKIQFLIVVRTDVAKNVRSVFTAFEELPLLGFGDAELIKLLLEKHLSKTSMQATPDAIQVLWEVFQGHPLDSLRSAQDAYYLALKKKAQTIDASTMAIACATHLRRLLQIYGEIPRRNSQD